MDENTYSDFLGKIEMIDVKDNLAPIVLFTYNRPSETQSVVSCLRDNYLARYSDLYVFSDGPRDRESIGGVEKTREIIRNIEGLNELNIFESSINKGLASSIIDGVTKILEKRGKAIILEDDIVTSPNFLDFMNQAIDFYESNDRVLSISGFTLPLRNMPKHDDVYMGYRASSWAWGTWERSWRDVRWDVSDFEEFYRNRKAKKRFNRGGSDMTRMLKNQIDGRIDSWAIRFCYHQFRNDLLTVFPTKSKAASIGFGSKATHTFNESRFRTDLDSGERRVFSFSNANSVDPRLAQSFREFFSIRTRVIDRLRRCARRIKLLT